MESKSKTLRKSSKSIKSVYYNECLEQAANNLKKACKDYYENGEPCPLSQTSLADRLEPTSRQTINSWMTGKKLPEVNDIFRLRDLFVDDSGNRPDLAFLLGAQSEFTKEQSDICETTGLSKRSVQLLKEAARNKNPIARDVTIGLTNYFIEHSSDLVTQICYDISFGNGQQQFDEVERMILEDAYNATFGTVGNRPLFISREQELLEEFRSRVSNAVDRYSKCHPDMIEYFSLLNDFTVLESYVYEKRNTDPAVVAQRAYARAQEFEKIVNGFMEEYKTRLKEKQTRPRKDNNPPHIEWKDLPPEFRKQMEQMIDLLRDSLEDGK